MGVRGLETFCENNCPSAFYKVSIQNLVEKEKKKSNKQPVIAIDGSSCMSFFYGDDDWIHGGQYLNYVAYWQRFLTFFRSLDVRIVIFFDGFTVDRKRAKWCERRLKSAQEVEEVFRLLRKGVRPHAIPENIRQIPAALPVATRVFLKSSSDCTYYTSVQECDEEIVNYAVAHHCFAILGQDSDYLIYNGPFHYLSVKYLDLDAGTTYVYDKHELAAHLQFAPDLLPLYASLLGNDIIPRNDLLHFHRRLFLQRKFSCVKLFIKVGEFVRRYQSIANVIATLSDIAVEVFGHVNSKPLLETSIRSYIPMSSSLTSSPHSDNWTKIVRKTTELMQVGEVCSSVYGVVVKLTFEVSCCLEDRLCSDLPPIALLYSCMRTRMYGILLRERCLSHIITVPVTELCSTKAKPTVHEVHVLGVSVPPDLHPGLLVLWTSPLPQIAKIRLQLLVWSVTGRTDFPIEDLQSFLPCQYQAVVLICRYLLQFQFDMLKRWEMDALLIQSILLQRCNPSNIKPSATDVRGVNLATIFLKGIAHLNVLNGAVGSPFPSSMLTPTKMFDGLLFHDVYIKKLEGIPGSFDDLPTHSRNMYD